MSGYYVVMCKSRSRGPMDDTHYEEYTGRHWRYDQELDAQEELWDAQHDGDVEDAYIKEVCPW